jgi:Chalcone isomerase-like
VPNSGTVVSVDGKPVAEAIPDEAFYHAILRIWLGEEPADSNLKPAMLGTKS